MFLSAVNPIDCCIAAVTSEVQIIVLLLLSAEMDGFVLHHFNDIIEVLDNPSGRGQVQTCKPVDDVRRHKRPAA